MLNHEFSNSSCDPVVISKNKESPGRKKSTLNNQILNQLKEVGYSMHSIIHSMEVFAEAVQEMEETILLPSRLMDLKIENPVDCKSISALVNLPDLYTLYNTIRNIKTQMQWGCKDTENTSSNQNHQDDSLSTTGLLSSGSSSLTTILTPSPSTSNGKGHTRRPSTASMSSMNSSAASVISESESEGSVENDSGIDAEMEKKPTSLENIEINFQKHLGGLKETLRQLTDAAKYVTKRYQKDVLDII